MRRSGVGGRLGRLFRFLDHGVGVAGTEPRSQARTVDALDDQDDFVAAIVGVILQRQDDAFQAAAWASGVSAATIRSSCSARGGCVASGRNRRPCR